MSNYAQQIEFLLSENLAASLGTVTVYLAGTTTLATIYSTRDKTVAANPFTLDAKGTAQLYADGILKIVVKDVNGVTLYSRDNLAFGLQNGPWIDVASYASLTAAVAAIGTEETTLLIDSVTTLTANTTIPETLKLIITSKGLISNGSYTLIFSDGAIDCVEPEWFGAKGDASTDSTAPVQSAINSALASNAGVRCAGLYKLTSSITIDRQVDGAAYDKYFTISSNCDGGFIVSTAIAMFSSSLPFTTAPVSQLVRFKGVTFSSTSAGLSAYVLDDSRFLRTVFDGCSFQKIKCLNATIYTQSIRFIGCNLRRWEGIFFNSPVVSFDFGFIDCIAEASSGSCIETGIPVGSRIIGSVIEGMSGTAISTNGAQGLTIEGNYLENNGIDLDTTGNYAVRGISFQGNFLSRYNSNYGVVWGQILEGVTGGNHCAGSVAGFGKLHSFTETLNNLRGVENDFAIETIYSTPPPQLILSGSYTATLTGCSGGSPTGAVTYVKKGYVVVLYIPNITGTSNSTAATLTGMPDIIKPLRQNVTIGRIMDNTSMALGVFIIDADGTITLGVNAEASGFTASGTKGSQLTTITYLVN